MGEESGGGHISDGDRHEEHGHVHFNFLDGAVNSDFLTEWMVAQRDGLNQQIAHLSEQLEEMKAVAARFDAMLQTRAKELADEQPG